jgi:carnitine O-palmitoyltransferase 1, liver isoform
MAEARNAIEYVKQKRGFDLFLSDDGTVTLTLKIPHPYIWHRTVVRVAYRWRNLFLYGLWPASPMALCVVCVVAVVILLNSSSESWWRTGWLAHIVEHSNRPFWPRSIVESFSVNVRVGYLAVMGSIWVVFIIMALERGLLRWVLSWHGWMSQQGRSSWKCRGWILATKVLTGFKQPRLTYSFQTSLPCLPVPSIDQTVGKFLKSVRPILTDAEYANMEDLGESFAVNDGAKMNQYLNLRAYFWSNNYVAEFWEKYVWLRARSPLCVNSNYYILDFCDFAPSRLSEARAATITALMVDFHKRLKNEQVEPIRLRGLRPLCMNQYYRMFGTTRVPGKSEDELQHKGERSRHVVVLRRGIYFKIEVIRWNGVVSTPSELEHQFLYIKQIADSMHKHGEVAESSGMNLAAMTGTHRTAWAEAREEYFSEGVNKASLEEIERALFFVSLDTTRPTTWSDRGSQILHGSGSDRWFDKSLTLVVFENGFCGLNAEHSWADAPVVAHMWEHCLCHEVERDGHFSYASTGHTRGFLTSPTNLPKGQNKSLGNVKLLRFHLNGRAIAQTRAAMQVQQNLVADLQLEIFGHVDYGKGIIKQSKISPDAFIQMAFQLAYYRSSGEYGLTYEACMTRMFRDGRTETVRSLSAESCAFVQAMVDPYASVEKRTALLLAACERHTANAHDALCGQGVERHIFALYVVSMAMNIESPFLQKALKIPWRLSTSQQPQRQTSVWDIVPKEIDDVCQSPGGGFGPAADDGYGISYMFAGADKIFFHVSSKRSSPKSDSEKFLRTLNTVLKDMKALLVSCLATKKQKKR